MREGSKGYRLFGIAGDVEYRGFMKGFDRKDTFFGYFIQRPGTDVITGYVEELSGTPFDPARYIKGIYDKEKGQLAIMKMCNINLRLPQAYVVHNVQNEGLWSNYYDQERGGFFPSGRSQGRVTVRISEIQDPTEKEQRIPEVWDKFSEMALRAGELNRGLLEDVDDLRGFLDPNSPFYLKPI